MAGRPEKYTISYFPHYVRESKTMFIIESKFGAEGYMFWFKLLELLCNSKNLYFDCNEDDNFEYLCAKTKINTEKALKILNTLSSMKKIDIELWENKIIWSQDLVDNVSDVFKRRKSDIPEKPLINANVSPIIDNNNSINVGNKSINGNKKPISAPQSKLNKIKEKNKEIYIVLFNYWNNKKIIEHKKLSDGMINKIKSKLDEGYTESEIKQAIHNYSVVLNGEDYYFKYRWTLEEFFQRGFEKFKNAEIAMNNYLKNKEDKEK